MKQNKMKIILTYIDGEKEEFDIALGNMPWDLYFYINDKGGYVEIINHEINTTKYISISQIRNIERVMY